MLGVRRPLPPAPGRVHADRSRPSPRPAGGAAGDVGAGPHDRAAGVRLRGRRPELPAGTVAGRGPGRRRGVLRRRRQGLVLGPRRRPRPGLRGGRGAPRRARRGGVPPRGRRARRREGGVRGVPARLRSDRAGDPRPDLRGGTRLPGLRPGRGRRQQQGPAPARLDAAGRDRRGADRGGPGAGGDPPAAVTLCYFTWYVGRGPSVVATGSGC
ncbi:hypothetical protein NOCARDAX2BIS_800002 [Nocardioides sp. AX2bis]|nr:hypothetical protein NOCARDAX2BIS_800002 [Nocardioides sp. AX2bis]